MDGYDWRDYYAYRVVLNKPALIIYAFLHFFPSYLQIGYARIVAHKLAHLPKKDRVKCLFPSKPLIKIRSGSKPTFDKKS